MRLVMEISGARTEAATDRSGGGRKGAAQIVDGSQAREPVRRNGRKSQQVLGWDSVERMRKFDSHYFSLGLGRPKELPDGPLGPAFVAGRSGRVRAAAGLRESRKPCRTRFL